MNILEEKLQIDEKHKTLVDQTFLSIELRVNNIKEQQNLQKEYSSVAFSTENFPRLYSVWLEPRMQLQIPSNFYQSILIDGQKLRNDWASGWLRVISFQNKSLFLLAHGFIRKEDKEFNLFLYEVEFKPGEYKLIKEDGNKIRIIVDNVKKDGLDLLLGINTSHIFSFNFIHTPTEHAFAPKNRIESSGLFRSAHQGKIAPKPITFDWSQYVITVPHFAFHSIIHQRYKDFGFNSAIEMQHSVTEFLNTLF